MSISNSALLKAKQTAQDLRIPEEGSSLIAYNQYATVQGKLAESVSVKDFGAIGDGISRPLSTLFSTLAAAQVVYPHATSLANELDWAAFQMAISTGRVRGGLTVLCPGSEAVYVLGEDTLDFLGGSKNIRFIGENGKLLFRRYGIGSNLIAGQTPVGIEFHNFTIEGGQLGLSGNAQATSGQGCSFSNPSYCIFQNVHFIDTKGFNILWYNNHDVQPKPRTWVGNKIIDCSSDGALVSASSFLFADLTDSQIVRARTVNKRGDLDTTYFNINLKGDCVNCSVIDFVADNCEIGVCLSEDTSPGATGIGVKNSRITGTASNCNAALASNKANGTYANLNIINCGLGANGAVSISGYNTKCTYDLTIKDLPDGVTAIYSASDDQQFNIQRYDNSGLYLYMNTSVGRRNEINVFGGPNRTSSLSNIQAKISAASEAVFPRIIDMRDLPNPQWVDSSSRWDTSINFPLPGGSRNANYLMMRSTGDILFQTLANPRLQFRNSLSTWKINGGLPEYADDAAAQAGGLEVGCLYRTGSVIKIRAA